MAYCSRCGVEVGPGVLECPLCRAPIQRFEESSPIPARYPVIAEQPGRQTRSMVWTVSTAVLISAALSLVIMDYVWNRRMTWSLYTLTAVGVLWLLITLIVALARRPIFVIVGQAVATTGFLVAIDLFNGRLEWFMPLALPIVAVVTAASVGVWLVSRLSGRAPLPIIAAVLIAVAVGSMAMDLLITAHFGAARLGWSLIVVGAASPLLGLLLIVGRRLGRRVSLAGVLHT